MRIFILWLFAALVAPVCWGQRSLPAKGVVSAVQRAEYQAAEKAVQAARGKLAQTGESGLRVFRPASAQKGVSPALGRSLAAAAQTARLAEEVRQKISPSLVQVINPATEEVRSSGFVFAENRSGRTQFWAAVPYHVAGRANGLVMLRLFRPDGSSIKYRVPVAVAGGYGVNAADLALCPLPDYAKTHAAPLLISPAGAAPGDVLKGYGFVVEDPSYREILEKGLDKARSKAHFNESEAMTVSETSGYKVTFPVTFVRKLSGACGTPYLDAQGRVAAIHSGSRIGQAVFAVNVNPALNDLLDLYYGENKPRPLLYAGRKVAEASVKESVSRIQVLRGGLAVEDVDITHFPGPFSYDKLEQAVHARSGDAVLVTLSKHREEVRTVRIDVP